MQQRQLRLLPQQHCCLGAALSGDIKSVCPNGHCIKLRDISTPTSTLFYVSTIEPMPATLSTDVRGDLKSRVPTSLRMPAPTASPYTSRKQPQKRKPTCKWQQKIVVNKSTGSIFYTAGGAFRWVTPSIYLQHRCSPRGILMRFGPEDLSKIKDTSLPLVAENSSFSRAAAPHQITPSNFLS